MGRWDRSAEEQAGEFLSHRQRQAVDGMADNYAALRVCFGPEYITIYGYRVPQEGSVPDVACNVDRDGTLEIVSTDEANAGPPYVLDS